MLQKQRHNLLLLVLLSFVINVQFALAQHDHSRQALQDTVGSGAISLAEAIQMQSVSSGSHIHHDDTNKADEHEMLLGLFPLASDSNVAVALNGGSWFDAAIWSTNQVPKQGKSVYIPHGISVIYDEVSDTALDRVAVNGALHFAVDRDTRLKVDSFFTGPSSTLTIGDTHNPVQTGVKAEIIIHRNNGPIQLADDPSLLTKGMVTHGAVRIVGQDKTDHLKTVQPPQAGDDYLLFESEPYQWRVGDKLVVAAVRNGLSRSTHQFERYEDEVVTIKSIETLANNDTRINLDQTLLYDHVPPSHSANVDLAVSVANYTRNIFIGTETSQTAYLDNGKTISIAERGHVMFMHNDDVLVKNAEFFELGRTNKAQFFSSTNISGRYSLHFHRTGVNHLRIPAVAQGNAIWGSPGWGIVHHDANVNMQSNAVFGAVGSGMVAEAGNETGRWHNNIVIQTTGKMRTFNAEQSSDSNGEPVIDHPAYQAEILNNSFAQGEAYGMKSRLLEITDNIAVSANGAGFSFWPHGASSPSHISSNGKDFEHAQGYDPFYGQNGVYPGKVPTRDFHGNEVSASRHALNTSANKIAHRHDMDVIIEDLLSWNVDQAIMSFYQENYIIKDSVFIRGEGNTEPGVYWSGGNTGNTASHIHDALDFKIINNYFEGYDTITIEPFQFILGNTVVGSSITEETGPNGRFREGATADNDTIDILDNSSNWRNNSNFANEVGYLFATIDLNQSDLVMTQWFDRFSVVVEKTDTVGTKIQAMGSQESKEFRGASQLTWWKENSLSDGYYRDSDGEIYLVVEAVVSDRITGTIGSIEAAISLEFLEGDVTGLPDGAIDNGILPDYLDENQIGTFKIVDQRAIGEIGNLLDPDDITPPILTEINPVLTPSTDTTPGYVFYSNEAGTVSFGGDCASTASTSVLAGNTYVDFAALSLGTHSNCTVTVTDAMGNASELLHVSSFTIETLDVPPVLIAVTVNQTDTQVDPTAANSALFTVIFSDSVDPTTFVASDIRLTETTGNITSGPTVITNSVNTQFTFTVGNMTPGDTATVSLPADRVTNLEGISNAQSTSIDNQVSYVCDGACPVNDPDNDGFNDSADNCPAIYNPDQTDLNNNLVGDVCEPVDNDLCFPIKVGTGKFAILCL